MKNSVFKMLLASFLTIVFSAGVTASSLQMEDQSFLFTKKYEIKNVKASDDLLFVNDYQVWDYIPYHVGFFDFVYELGTAPVSEVVPVANAPPGKTY